MGEASVRVTSSAKTRRTMLRIAYFSVASLWGFMVGISALLIALNQMGRPLSMSSLVCMILVVAGAVALIGALLTAMLYREAVRGRRR
jgi:hypothetical protein